MPAEGALERLGDLAQFEIVDCLFELGDKRTGSRPPQVAAQGSRARIIRREPRNFAEIPALANLFERVRDLLEIPPTSAGRRGDGPAARGRRRSRIPTRVGLALLRTSGAETATASRSLVSTGMGSTGKD